MAIPIQETATVTGSQAEKLFDEIIRQDQNSTKRIINEELLQVAVKSSFLDKIKNY